MNVGIVGLGLIGGSMAKSIKARTAHTVWGVDLDSETMSLARMCGAIDAPLTDDNLPQCDLILIAIRPGAAIEWLASPAIPATAPQIKPLIRLAISGRFRRIATPYNAGSEIPAIMADAAAASAV